MQFALADGHIGDLEGIFAYGEAACVFFGEDAIEGGRVEPEALGIIIDALGAEGDAHFIEGDIAGIGEGGGEGLFAVAHAVAAEEITVVDIDGACAIGYAFGVLRFEICGSSDYFED